MEEWRIKKQNKYEALAENIRSNKAWSTYVFTVEVGARGFVSKHAIYVFNQLGLTDKKLTHKLSRCAIRASHFIWINRENKEWKSPVRC